MGRQHQRMSAAAQAAQHRALGRAGGPEAQAGQLRQEVVGGLAGHAGGARNGGKRLQLLQQIGLLLHGQSSFQHKGQA